MDGHVSHSIRQVTQLSLPHVRGDIVTFIGINAMDLPPSGWLPRSSGILRRAQIWDRKNGDGDFEVFLLLF